MSRNEDERPPLHAAIFERDGQWYFHFVAANGEIVAQSEGYTDRRSALDAVRLITSSAASAPLREGV